jgi:peptide/nickel transport system substrate-binding protein
MNTIKFVKFLGLTIVSAVLLTACNGDNGKGKGGGSKMNSKKANDASVTVWLLSEPESLNPITSVSDHAQNINNLIFSRLLEFDQKTLQLVPQLAIKRPEIKEITEGEYKGGMSLTYEIAKEAVWDDGKPVTAYDYIFTVKTIKVPMVNSGQKKPYFEFVNDIVVDDSNNKKFIIYSKDRYFSAEESSGDLQIIPEHIYDPEGLLKKISIKNLNAKYSELASNDELSRFADQFNDPKFDRQVIVGAGPYKFTEWKNGQYLVLDRKKNWWGDKLKDNPVMKAVPPKITFKVVSDEGTAITNAQDESLDVLRLLKPRKFIELKEDDNFQKLYDLSTPETFNCIYLGINTKNPKFSDKRVRKALAHLVNKEDIITSLYSELAIKCNSPINPKKPYYNNDLKEVKFDVEAAKKLLADAGWTDSDKNGVVDKSIGGKKTEMTIKFKYNEGNEIRKNIGLLFQEAAKQAGIKVELEVREWQTYMDEVKARNYDVVCSGWNNTSPNLDDLKQVWHTSSDTPDGSNRTGFGNAETDKIIDEIRTTFDEKKRNDLYKRIQEIIHDEMPCVFICVPSACLVIHKRFKNTETSVLAPGYRLQVFDLK